MRRAKFMGMGKIKDLKVIEKLKEHEIYYSSFETLVKDYSNYLDTGAPIREIGFTPHDFSHHCRDIYKILGIILPEQFYKTYSKGGNLYLLLTSVLFHDISMAQKSDALSRLNHSETGKDKVLDEIFNDTDTSLNRNYIKDFAVALGDVIYAHSDVKDEAGNIVHYSFLEILDKYKNDSVVVDDEKINVPFIAALLRLADELDISYKRVEDTGFKSKDNSADSRRHYEICEYFQQVRVPEHESAIEIAVFEPKFQRVPEKDRLAIAGLILEKYFKIEKEFEVLYKNVLSCNKYVDTGIWNIESIKLKNEQMYRELLKKKVL